MKTFLLALLFTPFISISQIHEDVFTPVVGVTVGFHELKYNHIVNNAGINGTNYTMNEWVYTSNNFEIEYKSAVAAEITCHFGLHLPFYSSRYWSIGAETRGSMGFRKDLYGGFTPEFPELEGDFQIQLSGFKMDLPIEIYFSHLYGDAVVTAGVGYKFYKDYYNYGSPTLSFAFTKDKIRLQLWSNLTRPKYYREYSDGEIEMNRAYFTCGLSVSYLFRTEKKKVK